MNELTVNILKWTAIVFAAGFVGYFGRYLSMQIIEKMRKKKAEEKRAMSKYDYKLEKKKTKAEKKKAKAKKK
ncbi:hypothetical protein KY335_02930 [Candidatus Woesearchaeota archaeon]|nr:hypothetical protein [Candidatus Woesearchaeota archaeon]